MSRQTKKRTWEVHAHPDTGVVDRNEAVQAFVEAETILERLGGVIMVAPRRMENDHREWAVVGYVFQWESYVPPHHDDQPAAAGMADEVGVEDPVGAHA